MIRQILNLKLTFLRALDPGVNHTEYRTSSHVAAKRKIDAIACPQQVSLEPQVGIGREQAIRIEALAWFANRAGQVRRLKYVGNVFEMRNQMALAQYRSDDLPNLLILARYTVRRRNATSRNDAHTFYLQCRAVALGWRAEAKQRS